MIAEYDNIMSGYSFIFLKGDNVMTAYGIILLRHENTLTIACQMNWYFRIWHYNFGIWYVRARIKPYNDKLYRHSAQI